MTRFTTRFHRHTRTKGAGYVAVDEAQLLPPVGRMLNKGQADYLNHRETALLFVGRHHLPGTLEQTGSLHGVVVEWAIS